jgi:hypothetical protein
MVVLMQRVHVDKREWRAGFCRQFADALEAKDVKALHHIFGQKGCDWQIENDLRAFSWRNDDDGPGDIAGKSMGGAPAAGDRAAMRDAASWSTIPFSMASSPL